MKYAIIATVFFGLYIIGMLIFFNPTKRKFVRVGMYDELEVDNLGNKYIVSRSEDICTGLQYREWVYYGHHNQTNSWFKIVLIVYYPINWMVAKSTT